MGRFDQYPLALYVAVLVSLLGAFQTGYHFGILNTALHFISQDLRFTLEGGGAIVTSALLLGGALGALTAGQTADILGLKRAVSSNNLLLALGCLIGSLAQGINGLTLGRLITGIGSGAATVYVPRYIAEISPPSIRGSLSSCNQHSFWCVSAPLWLS
ncbi:hypothetical protein WJX74_001289 [Apatococcus lobatus]|uniref:Major facilitator superfamily (MFS) profile domain-containing protein n=1 Tax=Apatococcus lobatus TaxID=904363 RepID=A0AAW1R0Z7_9CHLO